MVTEDSLDSCAPAEKAPRKIFIVFCSHAFFVLRSCWETNYSMIGHQPTQNTLPYFSTPPLIVIHRRHRACRILLSSRSAPFCLSKSELSAATITSTAHRTTETRPPPWRQRLLRVSTCLLLRRWLLCNDNRHPASQRRQLSGCSSGARVWPRRSGRRGAGCGALSLTRASQAVRQRGKAG